MKTIKLVSKLGESETLIELKKISDKLLKLGKLTKGDEIVIESGYEGDKPVFTLNEDILEKNMNLVKPDLQKLGTLVEEKKFDENNPNPDEKVDDSKKDPTPDEPKDTSKVATGDDKETREKSIVDNKVNPAVTLHDTSELLFDLNNKTESKMENVKDLLFSEEELQPKVINFDELLFSDEEINGKTVNFDDLLFSEEEINGKTVNFDDLLFSEEEIKKANAKVNADISKEENEASKKQEDAEKKADEAKKENDQKAKDEHFDEKPEDKKEDPKPADDSKNEIPEPEKKEDPKKGESLHDSKDECPIEKAKAAAALKDLYQKIKEGKELTVEQKFFCDTMKKYFSDEEIAALKPSEDKDKVGDEKSDPTPDPKKGEKKEEPKKDPDPKPSEDKDKVGDEKSDPTPDPKKGEKKEEPKKDPDPKPETRDELIRRLNKEHEKTTLLGAAKAARNKIL